jgi:ribosome-associated translation inhibitor RaiA
VSAREIPEDDKWAASGLARSGKSRLGDDGSRWHALCCWRVEDVGMNIDIQTEHVAMKPEWHRTIDAWVERCRRHHPEVVGLDLSLRHDDAPRPGDEVDVVATAGRRTLRAVKHAGGMDEALHAALESLEHELLVHEAVNRGV